MAARRATAASAPSAAQQRAARAARLEEALRGVARMTDQMRGTRGPLLEQRARDLIAHVGQLRRNLGVAS